MIVSLLYVSRDADFVFLQCETGLAKGNLSSHLVRLEDAGYVHIEKMFREKVPLALCSLTDTGRAEFENYRKTVKRALRR